MTRSRQAGQASVEAIAAVPLIVVAVLLAWQLAALVRGAIVAQERLRVDAAAAAGRSEVTVTSTVTVPALVPGLARLRIPVRGVVLAP